MSLRHYFIALVILFMSNVLFAQAPQKVIVYDQDPHGLYKFELTDTTKLFYIQFVPKVKPVGCLVIMPALGELVEEVIQQISLYKLAVQKGFLVILPSINWGSNKFIAEHTLLDTIFKGVVEKYQVPKNNFILGGLSRGGMISLTYTQKANRDNKATYLIPRAVFALDPPLDFTHLYHHAKRDIESVMLPKNWTEKWRWVY